MSPKHLTSRASETLTTHLLQTQKVMAGPTCNYSVTRRKSIMQVVAKRKRHRFLTTHCVRTIIRLNILRFFSDELVFRESVHTRFKTAFVVGASVNNINKLRSSHCTKYYIYIYIVRGLFVVFYVSNEVYYLNVIKIIRAASITAMDVE
jgi:hypothetical protein